MPEVIVIVECENGEEWRYEYKRVDGDVYVTEDGENYSYGEIMGFRDVMRAKGILSSYHEE